MVAATKAQIDLFVERQEQKVFSERRELRQLEVLSGDLVKEVIQGIPNAKGKLRVAKIKTEAQRRAVSSAVAELESVLIQRTQLLKANAVQEARANNALYVAEKLDDASHPERYKVLRWRDVGLCVMGSFALFCIMWGMDAVPL